MSCFLHAARLRSVLSLRSFPRRVDSKCPRRLCNSEASRAVLEPSRPPEHNFGAKKGKFTELIEVSDKESTSLTRRIKTVSAARALQGISTEDLVFHELSSTVEVVRTRINELGTLSDKDLDEHVVFSRRVCNLLSPLVKHRRVLAVLLGRSEKITQGSYGSLSELNYILGKALDPWMLRFSRYKQREDGEIPDANSERARLRILKNNLDNLSIKLQRANVVDWPTDDVGYVRSYLDKALRDPAKAAQERTGRAPKTAQNPKLTAEQRLAAAMRASSTAVDDPLRDSSFRAGLRAHLELLLHLNRPHDAVETFYHYLRVSAADDSHPRVASRELFNVVLKTEAEQAHLKGVKKFYSLMTDFGVEPNAASFASVLECIGRLKSRQPSASTTEMVDQILNDLSKRSINVYNVVHSPGNSVEQKNFICDAIREKDPNFVLPEISLDLKYVERNELLSPLRVESCDAPGPSVGVLTKDQIADMAKEQLATEVRGYVDVEPIARLAEAFVPKEQDEAQSDCAAKKLPDIEKSWRQTLTDVFSNELASLESQIIGMRRQQCITLLPYLQVLPPTEYVDIMMQEIRRLSEGSETFSLSTRAMSKQLGATVMHRYFVRRKVDAGIMAKVEELYDKYLDHTVDPKEGEFDLPRVAWQKLIADSKAGPDIEALPMIWPVNTMVAVGKILHQIVVSHIKIDARLFNVSKSQKPLMVPAFFKLFRSQGVLTREELKVHPTVAKLYRLGSAHPLRFDAEVVPMVSPPLPWISTRMGGYLTSSAKIVRLPFGAHQQFAELNKVPPQQLYPTYDSLNQLGSVPWIVNKPILDLAIDIFVAGGDDALEVPKPPSACPPAPAITNEMSKKEKYKAFQEKSQLKRQKGEMYSLWCDALYKLSIANHFRDKILWFPHNIDFRGRAYPCPPHFNHLGADLTRSLLLFAKGVPLGEKGFEWLKVHTINLTGHKKRDPVRRRLAYANDMMGEIMDSAERPLNGNGWWKTSDEPWQTLAACKEVVAAMRCENGPEGHISHFPVHQDGSCNGLQHYAALGRDPQGAYSVNLAAADEPQDVYSDVAAMVERERQKDADNEVQIARQLEGLIKRKVIKQTVMTTVYGVTRFGARLQIAKQLKDLDDFPQDLCFAASQYLTAKTFHCLQEMFTGTKFIQDWFTECARLISGVCGQSVEWVSPLGLPVVQPYHRPVKRPVTDGVDFHRLRATLPHVMEKNERPNTMKQKNAFPPNFIHSLDSCHMMLTSLSCQKAGISFISVHDCYWTHPSTVDFMNEICRNQFVALHSQPILEDLRDFLVKKYSFSERELDDTGSVMGIAKRKLNRVLTEVPEKGSFDLEQVKQSTYFFS